MSIQRILAINKVPKGTNVTKKHKVIECLAKIKKVIADTHKAMISIP